eukprot:gene1805-16292_t
MVCIDKQNRRKPFADLGLDPPPELRRGSANPESSFSIATLNNIIKNYDRKIRPNTFGPPTKVQVEMKIVTFGPIDESKQEYTLDIFFRQWWNDPSLAGAVNRTVTMALNPASLFWIPDTYFVNAKEPKFQYVTKEAMRVLVKPNGDIYYSSRIMLVATCPMDFSLYPFDKQTCPLVVESYSYTTEDVFYSWYESVGKLRKTKGVEWIASEGNVFTLVDVSSVQKEISNNSKGAFSSLKVNFHLVRRNGFYFWNTFLPGAILVVMTWVNFWIPPWAYPARVTVCVTSFLSTLFVMSAASSNLGRVSYVKALDQFLLGNVVFVLLNLLQYCLVLHSWFDINLSCCKKFKTKKKSQDRDSSLGQINELCELEKGENGGMANAKERSRTNSFAGISRKSSSVNGLSKERSFTSLTDHTFANNARNGNGTQARNRKNSTILAMKQFQEKYDLSPEDSKKAHPLDYISRFVFPLSYVCFVLGYSFYYKLL